MLLTEPLRLLRNPLRLLDRPFSTGEPHRERCPFFCGDFEPERSSFGESGPSFATTFGLGDRDLLLRSSFGDSGPSLPAPLGLRDRDLLLDLDLDRLRDLRVLFSPASLTGLTERDRFDAFNGEGDVAVSGTKTIRINMR